MSGNTSQGFKPVRAASKDLDVIAKSEASIRYPHFTVDDAWTLGTALRARLLPFPKPVVINIALANSNQLLFHTATKSGVSPDNDIWIARKRKTVLRFGCSSYYMGVKMGGDENAFAAKYGLGDKGGEYAIHGGGIPIKVEGVEGVVAVVIVSGLKQEEDHEVIVETIEELLGKMK